MPDGTFAAPDLTTFCRLDLTCATFGDSGWSAGVCAVQGLVGGWVDTLTDRYGRPRGVRSEGEDRLGGHCGTDR